MTHQQHYVRAAITVTCATLFVLVLSASPASAAYRAWYAPWDNVAQFEEGDVSEDQTKMTPPFGACGLRIVSPGYYRWVDDDENTVEDEDGVPESGNPAGDVIIWLGAPGCSNPFSTNDSNGEHTLDLPDVGAVYIEISESDGAHWVDDDGCHLSGCGGVDGPNEEAIAPHHNWSLSTVSAFKAVSAGIVDPRRQPRAVIAIATLSGHVAQLQPILEQLIADRRRSPLGMLEASVRSLEDAAWQALTAARSAVATCEKRAGQLAYTDAFVACTTAGRSLEHSGSLIRTANSLFSQPAK